MREREASGSSQLFPKGTFFWKLEKAYLAHWARTSKKQFGCCGLPALALKSPLHGPLRHQQSFITKSLLLSLTEEHFGTHPSFHWKEKITPGKVNSQVYATNNSDWQFQGGKETAGKVPLNLSGGTEKSGEDKITCFTHWWLFPVLLLILAVSISVWAILQHRMITVIRQMRSFPPLLRWNPGSVTGRTRVPRTIPLGCAGIHGSTPKTTSINSRQPFPSRGGLQALPTVYSPRNKCTLFPTLDSTSVHQLTDSYPCSSGDHGH